MIGKSNNIFLTGIDGSLGRAIERRVRASSMVNVVGTPIGIGGDCSGSIKEQVEAAIRRAGEGVRYCDTLILNDGTNLLSWIGETPEAAQRVLNINLAAPYWFLNWFVKNAARPMRVLFIASLTHRVPQRCTSLYCASKAGVVQMMRVAARELSPKGWTVNALSPGKIENTRMSMLTDAQVEALRGWSPEEADRYARSNIPIGRYSSVEEMADGVAWALSAPEFVTGAVLEMTGGA